MPKFHSIIWHLLDIIVQRGISYVRLYIKWQISSIVHPRNNGMGTATSANHIHQAPGPRVSSIIIANSRYTEMANIRPLPIQALITVYIVCDWLLIPCDIVGVAYWNNKNNCALAAACISMRFLRIGYGTANIWVNYNARAAIVTKYQQFRLESWTGMLIKHS